MPQDRKEYMKAYNKANKEKKKLWYENSKEKIKAYTKEYNEKNSERILTFNKSVAGRKIKKISIWKSRGLIHDDYDDLYDKYFNATRCEECDCVFGIRGDKSGTFKCMDHDHETGLFRNFLCATCNVKRG